MAWHDGEFNVGEWGCLDLLRIGHNHNNDLDSPHPLSYHACKLRIRYVVLARGGHSEKFVWSTSMLTIAADIGGLGTEEISEWLQGGSCTQDLHP